MSAPEQPDAVAEAVARINEDTFKRLAETARMASRVEVPRIRFSNIAVAAPKFPVAPQLAESIASVVRTQERVLSAAAQPPTFNFAKTLDAIQGMRLAPTLTELGLSERFAAQAAAAVRAASSPTFDIQAVAGATLADAAAVAATDAADIFDEPKVDSLTPSRRKELALDVITVVAALVTLEMALLNGQDVAAAAGALFYLGAFLRLYWRLTNEL